MDGSQRLGDQFKQNHRSMRSQEKSRNDSFVSIQQEQERDAFYSNRRGGIGEGSRRGVGGMNDKYRGGQRRNTQYRNEGPNYSDMPLEQGKINTLLDKFGFIYCADRPSEIFFHYSELNINPDDLNVGDEVEFYVGASAQRRRGGNSDGKEEKLSAYSVKLLEPGSVQWVVEDEPIGTRRRGRVERVSRSYTRERDRSGGPNEGTIRIIAGDCDGVDASKDKTGSLVRYTATNFNGSNDSQNSRSNSGNGLARNDLVEFTVVTEKRSGLKYVRDITMIQSERERLEKEREKTLLESATREKGIVISLKDNFGFLRSNKRREEVYFHYSHVILPETVTGEDEERLAEGQNMEFLVVTEKDERRKKCSARQVKFLEEGSVVFEQVLAHGVTGMISKCPSPASVNVGGRNRHANNSGTAGKVLLDSPITYRPVEDEIVAEMEISEVTFKSEDSPGGSYAMNRDGSRLGMWVREGDIILFDVIRDVVDGKCRVAPTKCLRPSYFDSKEAGLEDKQAKQGGADKVRLIATSLGGRAEGVISSIKDNYGFIQLAERNVDTYFRLYELFPLDIQNDLTRNAETQLKNGENNNQKLDVGCEVSFDLSLQPSQHNNSASSRGKEQLRAQRLAFLPPSTLNLKKKVASGIKGTVVKESPRQNCAGQIELDSKVTGMTNKERHPMFSQLLESVRSKGVGFSTNFHDVQSEREYQVINEMIAMEDDIELHLTPISGDYGDNSLSRITIKNVGKLDESELHIVASKESKDSLEASDDTKDRNESQALKTKKRKSNKKDKSIKTCYFDKNSLSSDFEGSPPGKGDIIICDIIQCRRTAVFSVSNLKMIERNASVKDQTSSKMFREGFVIEANESRQCGRISVVSGNFAKRQILSFFYSDVRFDSMPSTEKAKIEESRSIQKGDEVTFDIVRGIDRKLIAMNVAVIPQGTISISSKLDKSECQGYILLEPSYSSRTEKVPSMQENLRMLGNEGGRWDKCIQEVRSKPSDGSNMNGRILLLSDPGYSFGKKNEDTSNLETISDVDVIANKEGASESPVKIGSCGTPETVLEDPTEGVNSLSLEESSTIYSHLFYGNSSVWGRGPGFKAPSIDAPKRGDLVSFSKGKGGKIRDVRVIKSGAATAITGNLININVSEATATFCGDSEMQDSYHVPLSEVISCEVDLLKESDKVKGVLHGGKVFGVCRTADLYIKSTLGSGLKQRPRLNLTVKRELKDLGGKIIAQSGMAKGPDGTIGFTPSWTKRISRFAQNTSESNLQIPNETMDKLETKEES